jgi:hypothetical protein
MTREQPAASLGASAPVDPSTFLATRRLPPARLRTAEAQAVFLGLRQTEKAFQAEVVRYARLMGWMCFFTTDSRHSPAGWPDLVLIRRRRIVFAELKADLWRPSDWEEIERCLR